MDLEGIGEDLLAVLCTVIITLALVIPICLCVSHCKDREFELEKYRIEMELQKDLIPKDVLKEDR